MAKDVKTWKLNAQALVAKRILAGYVLSLETDSPEVESFVSDWLEENMYDYDQDFHDGVLTMVLYMMREGNGY